MPSLNDTRAVLETYFLGGAVPVQVVTSGQGYVPQLQTPYVALTVDLTGRNRITLGRGVWRVTGVLTFQCFGVLDQNANTPYFNQAGALSLCDIIAELLDVDSLNGAEFQNVKVQDIGNDGSFYQVNLSCSFWRDETEL